MFRNIFICCLSLTLFISEITCQSRNQSLILSSDQFNIALINWLQVYPLLYSMCHWAMEIHSIHFLKLNIKILIKLFLCCYCSKYFYSVFLYFFIFAFSEYLPFLISFTSNLLWISCFSGFRFKINTTFLS